MRKISILLCALTLWLLAMSPPLQAVGTCTVSDVTSSQIAAESNRIADANTVIVTLTCTGSSSDGSFPSTTVPISGASPSGSILNTYNLTGYYLYQVGRTPGTTSPTASYTVTITDAKAFALDLGLLTTNGSASAAQITAIQTSTTGYPVVRSDLTVAITGNSVDSAQITLDLIFRANNAASLGGGGAGTVTTTGSPVSGNLTKFSGANSITGGDLTGDVTTSGTLATTVTNINGFPACSPLDITCFSINEEFCGGALTTLAIGTMGWGFTAVVGGTPTFSYQAGAWPNICVLQMNSAAVSGDGVSLSIQGSSAGLGVNLAGNPGWKAVIRFKALASSGIIYRIGFIIAGDTAILPNNWYGLRFDPSLGSPDTTLQLCSNVVASETCYDTTLSPDTNFHDLTVRGIAVNKIGLKLDSGAERTICSGGTCDINVAPSVATGLSPGGVVASNTGTTAESVQFDAIKMIVTGLAR